MIRSRKSSGNMLTLVVLTIGIIVAVAVSGFTYNWFLFRVAQAQSKGDALATSLASRINVSDRVGQINELEQCSRELVYTSRKAYEACDQEDLKFLDPLCYQLLDEARAGHALVEQERRNQIGLITRELSDAATAYNASAIANGGSMFLGVRTSEPRITGISVGYLRNTYSNVKSLGAIKDLVQFDQKRDYIDPRSKLYLGNLNARLPEDSDLPYDLSYLPACVDGTASPSRNINPDAFVQTGTIFANGRSIFQSYPDHIPDSVQVYYGMDAAVGRNTQGTLNLVSTAVTNGAIAGSN